MNALSDDKPTNCIAEELWSLAEAVCTDTATPEQYERLNARLLADEDAAVFYATYLRMHGHLMWQSRHEIASNGASVQRSLPLPPALSPSVSWFGNTFQAHVNALSQSMAFSYVVAAVVVSVGILIASLVPVSRSTHIVESGSKPHSSASVEQQLQRQAEPIGHVTALLDCQWADSRSSAIVGEPVSAGQRYKLSGGLMEITYDSGAKVVLEGPVTYEVESCNGGFLALGKLTARVDKKAEVRNQKSDTPNPSHSPAHLPPASLFCIRTPSAIVTDLGTEFAVEVDARGQTVSHVFRGTIELAALGSGGAKGTTRVLHANEAGQVKTDRDRSQRSVSPATVDSAAFVRPGEVSKIVEERRLKPLRRWQAVRDKLRLDPTLLAYYDFQQEKTHPSVLVNVAGNGDHTLDGTIQNAVWSNGRMPGKHALRFHSRADRVEVNLPQVLDDLTLAAWVCVDSLATSSVSEFGYAALLTSNGWTETPGKMHWQVRSDGRLGFIVCNGCNSYQALPGLNSQRLGRWMQMATVYDHKAARARFYINGMMTDDAVVEQHAPICVGSAWIGHWNGWELGRNLLGWMDEMAVFSRPLATEEIRRMFEAGKPEASGDRTDSTDLP